jgi:uncharacterized protein YndB with AHSA1/START domain
MSEYGEYVGRDAVRFERLLPAPVDVVWAYLTEPDKRARWFAGGEIEPRVGGKVALEFHNSRLTDEPVPERWQQFEGIIGHGEVTRWEPPNALAHLWFEDDGTRSEVVYELAAQGDGTRLVLTHRRLATRDALVDVSGGWHAHLGLLEAVLQGRTPQRFWATVLEAEKEYAKRLEG